MTQQQLADRAGVSIFVIRRLERGISAPSLLELEKIANALGQTLYDLFLFARPLDDEEPEEVSKKRDELNRIIYMLRRHTFGELEIVRAILRDIFQLQRHKMR
jgi:transcriptional regulator with XRE-family HTH domain